MRRILILITTAALVLGVAPAAQAVHARPANTQRAVEVCPEDFALVFDVAKAATVPIVVGKAKKTRPAGTARAQQLANALADTSAPTVCTMSVTEWDQATLDEIQSFIDAGEIDTAIEYIASAIEGISVPTDDPARRIQSPRAADACSGFGMSEFDLPADIALALSLGAKAQLVGNDGLSTQALDKARSIMEKFAESGAGGQAQTIGDWLRLAAQIQLLGGDEATADSMFDKARDVAKKSYDEYNRSMCRHTKQTVTCYFKAAMAMMLLGVEPEPSKKDMGEAGSAAAALNMGRRPPGCIETYSFRWRLSWELDNGQFLTMDTGPVVFDAEFGKITSEDKGPLTLSSAQNVPCWEKSDESWVQSGLANVTGGSFPYRVAGTDLDGTLRIRLFQRGAWKITGDGNMGCQLLINLGEQVLSAFPKMLDQGIEIPAGVKNYEYDDISHQFHEPTGKTLTSHWYFSLKLLKSTSVKR